MNIVEQASGWLAASCVKKKKKMSSHGLSNNVSFASDINVQPIELTVMTCSDCNELIASASFWQHSLPSHGGKNIVEFKVKWSSDNSISCTFTKQVTYMQLEAMTVRSTWKAWRDTTARLTRGPPSRRWVVAEADWQRRLWTAVSTRLAATMGTKTSTRWSATMPTPTPGLWWPQWSYVEADCP